MKTFKLLFAFVVSLIFFGCETKNVEKHSTEYQINGSNLQIYVIDSCEYIGLVYGGQSDKLTHKGNCKFCAVRNKE
jgi:hypothetical protein